MSPQIYNCYRDFVQDCNIRRYFKHGLTIVFVRYDDDDKPELSYHNSNPIVCNHWIGAVE